MAVKEERLERRSLITILNTAWYEGNLGRKHLLLAKPGKTKESKNTENVDLTVSTLEHILRGPTALASQHQSRKEKTRATNLDSCRRRKNKDSNQEHEGGVELIGFLTLSELLSGFC